jgi:uncharacterized surface anchored protein
VFTWKLKWYIASSTNTELLPAYFRHTDRSKRYQNQKVICKEIVAERSKFQFPTKVKHTIAKKIIQLVDEYRGHLKYWTIPNLSTLKSRDKFVKHLYERFALHRKEQQTMSW